MLYGKEAYKGRPNASTTKVMTCILALELAKGDDYVQVSGNGGISATDTSWHAGRPAVLFGGSSLFPDAEKPIMIPQWPSSEHIGGSVEGFAEKMNEKAKELGCKDTHFVTPNGLDGEDEAVSIIQRPGILP